MSSWQQVSFQTHVVQLMLFSWSVLIIFRTNTYNALVDCECCICQSTKKDKTTTPFNLWHNSFTFWVRNKPSNYRNIHTNVPIQSKLQYPFRQTLGISILSLTGEWRIWPLPQQGGENWTGSGRFQRFFFCARDTNSYKHIFQRDGRLQRKRYSSYLSDFFFHLATELSNGFWLCDSSLSNYRMKTVWYVFTPPFRC